MKLKFRKRTSDKVISRLKNKVRIRKKVTGTGERPRLTMYRSARHIYAQIVDDVTGKTIVAASTLNTDVNGYKGNVDAAKSVGAAIAKKAQEKNINNVVFDRSGYVYHGRVKALAEGAREAGLNF